jgi:hypothetical protein
MGSRERTAGDSERRLARHLVKLSPCCIDERRG